MMKRISKFHSKLFKYINGAFPFEGRYFTCTTVQPCIQIIFSSHKISLTPPRFIEVLVPSYKKGYVMYLCVKGTDLTSFYDFSIGLLNCPDSMIFSVFHFNLQNNINTIFFLCSFLNHGIIQINP